MIPGLDFTACFASPSQNSIDSISYSNNQSTDDRQENPPEDGQQHGWRKWLFLLSQAQRWNFKQKQTFIDNFWPTCVCVCLCARASYKYSYESETVRKVLNIQSSHPSPRICPKVGESSLMGRFFPKEFSDEDETIVDHIPSPANPPSGDNNG